MTPYVIMLEDDTDDRSLVKEILSESAFHIPVSFTASSVDFFNFLSVSHKPALILIDYNATPENGIDVLKKLKKNPQYREIPVVVLSENDFPEYRDACYLNGASSFIKKPETLEGSKKKIETFFKYWFEVCSLPAY